MATVAERRRVACRVPKGIAVASKPCGARSARAGEMGIGILTIFAFSSENWSRPQSEIRDLLGLLRLFIRNDLADLHSNNVKVRIIGDRDSLER